MIWQDIEKVVLSGGKLNEDQIAWVKRKMHTYWDEHPDVVNRFPRWKKYIAWVAGYQLFDYNKISKKLVEVPLDRKRKLIFNRLKPFVRVLLAKLSSDLPQISVIPNTDEDEDIEAARAGDALIKGLSLKMGFDKEVVNSKLWTIICNRAFFRVLWDREAKGSLGKVEDPETGEMVETFEEGDVVIECVSPFNCRTDVLYHNRRKWRWFMYGEEVDATELEIQYELKRGTLMEKSNVLETAYDLELQDEQDIIIGPPDRDLNISGRTVVLKELWTPRCFFFLAGTELVEYGINEYEEIPFFDVEDRLIPIDNYERGFSYNESLIKDAIPIQRDYNRMVSLMSLALERASKLKVLTPLGSLLSKKQWTNDYGVFIDYNRNAGEPHQMKLEPFPMDVPRYKSELEREMESVMNLHESSFGRLPERASHPSGTLVNLLLEQDDAVLNPLLNSINHTIGEAWRLALRIVQSNYTSERMIRYVGDDGQPAVLMFKGSDLRDNTDVRVTSQTGLPRSRALRTEYIMRLRNEGLLTDQQGVLEMLEFGNAEKIFKDNLLHERKAYRENKMIEENPDITPEDIPDWVYKEDDDQAHKKIHLRFRLSTRYDKLNENQKNTLDFLIESHNENEKEKMFEQLIDQVKMQMEAQGIQMAAMQSAQMGGPSPEGGP